MRQQPRCLTLVESKSARGDKAVQPKVSVNCDDSDSQHQVAFVDNGAWKVAIKRFDAPWIGVRSYGPLPVASVTSEVVRRLPSPSKTLVADSGRATRLKSN